MKKAYWFIGRDGDIGPMGIRGIDSVKGVRGDNGTTSIGRPGDKGILYLILQCEHLTIQL